MALTKFKLDPAYDFDAGKGEKPSTCYVNKNRRTYVLDPKQLTDADAETLTKAGFKGFKPTTGGGGR